MPSILERFHQRTPGSAQRADRALRLMPGGDTRFAAHHAPYPLALERGEGPYLTDVDGHRYIDLLGNYTSLVHGNAYPPIVEVVREWAGRGTAWPARNDPLLELAELLVERVDSVEQVRFCNSGTEATMLAALIAREVTGRRKVLMAKHGYHGGWDVFEAGFLGREAPDTLLAPHGDAEAFEAVLAEQGDEVACVVLEPVMGSAGMIPSPPGFLARVQRAARGAGALFVLDEVITFRLAPGGAQELHGVRPDLTAFGKLIGGGFPVGAVGGRADLLEVTDPRRLRILHGGTFNGNPVTMAAGCVAVRHLTAHAIDAMGKRAERLASGLRVAAAGAGLPFSLRVVGSLLNLYLSSEPPEATLLRSDARAMASFHLAALNHGLFLAPRGMIALSTVLGDALLDEVIQRATAALTDVAAELEPDES